MAPHSSILAWKIPWTEQPGKDLCPRGPWGCKESDTTERLHFTSCISKKSCQLQLVSSSLNYLKRISMRDRKQYLKNEVYGK